VSKSSPWRIKMWGRRGAIALAASRYNLISSHYTTRNIWSLQLLESQTKSCISLCPRNIFIVFFAAKTTVSEELNMSRMAGYTCGYIWGKTNWPVGTTRNSSYMCIWSGDLWSSKFSTLSVFNVPKVLIFPTLNQCTPQTGMTIRDAITIASLSPRLLHLNSIDDDENKGSLGVLKVKIAHWNTLIFVSLISLQGSYGPSPPIRRKRVVLEISYIKSHRISPKIWFRWSVPSVLAFQHNSLPTAISDMYN
jgi:hypothetical protein